MRNFNPILLLASWCILAASLPRDAAAYPQFIGYGYTSCANCHSNPLGNGPLTDYGRAVGASAIAARPLFVPSTTSDDELGESSGFLGKKPLPEWLRPSIGYRGMYLSTTQQGQSLTRWINMQAEANLVLRTRNDRVFASGTLGLIPPPSGGGSNAATNSKALISREHYVAAKPLKRLGVYAGMMDVAFGLRVPDHTAWLRTKSFLDKNDQSHGVMLHYGPNNADYVIHVLAGNLLQTGSVRQRGFSLYGEVDAAEKIRVGGSALITRSDFRSRQMGAVHGRAGFGEGSAVMAQLGVINDAPISSESQLGGYLFAQGYSRLARGLNLILTAEYYTPVISGSNNSMYRAGPGLQYFPMQRLEVRSDFQGLRRISGTTLDPDSFTWMTQVHVWL